MKHIDKLVWEKYRVLDIKAHGIYIYNHCALTSLLCAIENFFHDSAIPSHN
jgi:hypothetical protein